MPIEPVPPDPELNAIESALVALRPSRGGVDRDQVMFRAGAASVMARRSTPGGRVWMAAASILALVATGEGALLATRPGPTVIVKTVIAPAPAREVAQAPAHVTTAPTIDPPPFGRTDHDRLVSQVARYGLDGLPGPSPTWAEPGPKASPSRQQLLEELNTPFSPGDPS